VSDSTVSRYVPDEDAEDLFVITAFEMHGKAK
jgi:hypothetical protein